MALLILAVGAADRGDQCLDHGMGFQIGAQQQQFLAAVAADQWMFPQAGG